MSKVVGSVGIDINDLVVKVKVSNIRTRLFRLKIGGLFLKLGARIAIADVEILGTKFKGATE